MSTTEDKVRQFVADRRKPRPDKPTNLDPLIATFLGRLVPRPDSAVSVAEFVALFRTTLKGHKQRQCATRKAVVESLRRLGVLTGLTHAKQRIIIGYALDPATALTVDEQGRVREVA